MKRKKHNTEYWRVTRNNLYKAHPEAQLVQNRQRTLRAILIRRYPFLKDLDKELAQSFLSDVLYNSRKLREDTEGMQDDLKRKLEQEWLIDNDTVI